MKDDDIIQVGDGQGNAGHLPISRPMKELILLHKIVDRVWVKVTGRLDLMGGLRGPDKQKDK